MDSLLSALYAAYDPFEATTASARAVCYEALSLLSGFAAEGYLSEESVTLSIDLAAKFVVDAYNTANDRTDSSGRRLQLAAGDVSAAVDRAVSGMVSGILSNMAEGEDPVTYSNSQIEVTVYKALSGNVTTLAPPVSGAISSHMELTASAAAALESAESGYIHASALVWRTNPFPNSTQLETSLFRVEVFGADQNQTARRSGD